MKKTLLFFALLCAVAQGAWAQNSWEEVYALTQTTSGDWTAINSGSTSGHTLGSTGNTTYYYVNSNLSFTNSNVGGSGLKIQGTVYLYVPEGVTLTCTGANANGQTGAGAGIELASGNTLYLLGGGTVNATGGNAANGGNGGTGDDAFLISDNTILGGSGGAGGNGGGGAGAGIGTRGANGGNGGAGGQRTGQTGDETTQYGVDGNAGSAGSTAGAMGNLYWLQSFVHLTATGGSAGSNGTGGNRGQTASQHPGSNLYMASGGGGGGAGGFGGGASNIGTGGPGGGGGGGGAAGNVAWVVYSGTTNGYYHAGAKGGKGGTNSNGTPAPDGADIELDNPKHADQQGVGLRPDASDYGDDAGWEVGNAWHEGGSGGAKGGNTTAGTTNYTIYSDVEVSSRINVYGIMVLNLGEGATLHAPKGIDVSIGNSLIINGPGTLTIDGCDSDKAGIGAKDVGTLTINGGIINVRGGTHGAGIGGDMYNVGGGTITINGGIVNANGGYGAAGIGGGVCGGTANYGQGTGMCGNVYIYGGQVTAVGGSMAAGIGPGVCTSISLYPPTSGNLTIGWTNPEDFLYNSGFYSQNGNYNETLSGISFVEGKQFIIDGLGEIANPSLPTNFGSRKILPLVDQATALPGSGSLSDPYRISNLSDWMKLAVNVNGGTKNYSGEYVRLENDLSVSIMVGKDETNSFQGTFLGNNKTLTFSYSTWEENTAPFRVTNNATIRDLKVAGSISTSAKFAAGLASRTFGTTSITNCQVDTYIHSNINGDGTHGGIVAMPSGTLNIEGCAFTGRLLTNKGTHSCGGFVGWYNSSTISVINSLYAPSSSIPSGWSAITGGATFVRGGSPTINNCYYTEKLGDVQGSLVLVYPSDPGNLGNVVQAYSTLTAYTNGIFCDDIYYLKAATFSGAGNEGSPYLISNEFEWKSFAAYVNSGSNTYSGKYMKLTADISVTEMVGSSEGNSFQGTFLGNGNTITASIISTTTGEGANEQGVAPFHYINNATIKDLTVAGSIASASYHTSGIVGFANGTNTIEGCVVTATLNISNNYAGGIIGHGLSSNTTIRGCVFAGTINGVGDDRENIGGIWGWSDSGTPTLQNCLEVGTYINIASMHPMGLQNNKGTITNCYYMNPKEGSPSNACTVNGSKHAYTFDTTPANLGDAGTDYGMVKAYANGILFDGKYYVPSTGNISRTVEGYGDETGKWAFIASPVEESIAPSIVTNLLGTKISDDPVLYDYDLYRLNPTSEMWENYNNVEHQSGFNLTNGSGYLYATKETKTLMFLNTFNMENEKTVGLSEGFNLAGNPFVVDAYASRSYYRMNAEGTDIEVIENYAATTIPVCTGVVVRATGPNESITFSTEAPVTSTGNNGNLQMTLTKAGARKDAFQDKAIVSFNEGSQLEKFIFNENHAKLYIPQYGEDYAIASSEMTGEIPLNFKTNETGRYTIGFNFENVKGVRIQIIDKLEDIIIDLNANDSYTFMGSTVDRSDRFTLVFTQVETDGIFAYQNGDDIIVSGEGELQVFDVMGRQVMTQHINGVETWRASSVQTGVYILRLNGKSQKIVIK